MSINMSVDERSLERLFADLDRNLGQKEQKKIMQKGTKKVAQNMKSAIKVSATALGVTSSSASVIKIKQYKASSPDAGHHVYVGRGSENRGLYPGGFEIPVTWIEFGTYNRRDLQAHPYTPATLKRHPDAYAKNARYPSNYGMTPKPFIRRASDSNRARNTDIMFKTVKDELSKLKISK